MLPLAVLMTLCTGWFAGAALYITLVEHPARVQCGSVVAVAEFGPSYRRAAVMQGGLSVMALGSGLGVWFSGGGILWLVWGLVMGALIPFTVLVIMPINSRLLDPKLDSSSPLASYLLARWARLHAVRTAAACAAFLGCLLELTGL